MQEKSRILKKINNECFGGSENQMRLLLKYLPDECFKDINLILNNTDQNLLEKDRINILWMQHFVNQEETKNMGSKKYIDKLDYIIFNSNWNFEKYQYQFKIPENKSLVSCVEPNPTAICFSLISISYKCFSNLQIAFLNSLSPILVE